MSRGVYADGRTYELPANWTPAEPAVLEVATAQALAALGAGAGEPDKVRRSLVKYFDPDGKYAGALFSTIGPSQSSADDITAADLLAVTTLSMTLDPRQIRQLLDPSSKRTQVLRALRQIDTSIPVQDLGSGGLDPRPMLSAISDLYRELRATPKPSSTRWVFASKLAARKRPNLLPVRDNVVCKFLAGERNLSHTTVGSHDIDLQIFGYLMSHPRVRDALGHWWSELHAEHGSVVDDVTPLRLLDVALWNAGIASGYAKV
ncbi:DUF6308 family protein [Nocardioides endophyticus]